MAWSEVERRDGLEEAQRLQKLYSDIISRWRKPYPLWQPHPRGVVDLHLRQQLSVYAEVAEAASLVVDDAVAFAGHWDEAGPLTQLRPLQGPQQVPCDGVDQARALWGRSNTKAG